MAKISSRHVLVVGSAMGLGEMLCQQFEFGNLPADHLQSDQLKRDNQDEVDQQIAKLNPVIVVNALPLDVMLGDADRRQSLLECNDCLLRACQSKSITVLQLSSALVFNGGDKKSYDETDKPTAVGALANDLIQCEQNLQAQIEKYILLRFGWLIDAQGDNIFTNFLQQLNQNQILFVDASVKGAPLWVDDALRVVLSLVRQLLAGSENWGVFHYASSDSCSEKEFAQQLIDTLEELQPESDYSLSVVPVTNQAKVSAVLKCRRIRNNFGIHGRTWRQGLKYRIQHWLEGRWLESSSEQNNGSSDVRETRVNSGVAPSKQSVVSGCDSDSL